MHFAKISSGIDVASLLAALDARPELWSEITARQDYSASAHKDTESIYLRGPRTFTYHDYFYDLGSYDYPAVDTLSDVLVPLLRPLLNALPTTELGRVLIVKLKPGGVIKPHIDQGLYADHFARFHLALTGDEGSSLTSGDETVHMAPGEFWWFDHKALHHGANLSDQSRIHLIIDAVSPTYPLNQQNGVTPT